MSLFSGCVSRFSRKNGLAFTESRESIWKRYGCLCRLGPGAVISVLTATLGILLSTLLLHVISGLLPEACVLKVTDVGTLTVLLRGEVWLEGLLGE